MLKLLLLAVAIWLVLLLLKHYRRSVDAPRASKQQEDMVRCEECGVYLPRSASILKHGAYFCCEQHSKRAGQ